MDKGRKDRIERLKKIRNGTCGTSSQDYLHLVEKLYKHSAEYARTYDGNVSIYALAGIPLLLTTLRALLIEANSGMFGANRDDNAMKRLALEQNERNLIEAKYLSNDSNIAKEMKWLYEVRNEIVHPSHSPAGTTHNTPESMVELRNRNLLQSTGNEIADYIWIAQLKSHRLFRWAYEIVAQVAEAVLRHDYILPNRELWIEDYRRYRHYDDTVAVNS